MSAVKDFIRREATLCAALLAAAVSCFIVPPDAGYLGYIDLRTLALLYCLMTVVAGLRGAGLFAKLAHELCLRTGTVRAVGLVLVALSFVSSMFITNDVALLTFVPFAVVVLGLAHQEKELIRVVVLQTAAANLGSMLTPVGNPQNLYIYSHYGMSAGEFFSATLPVWGISGALTFLLCLALPRERISVALGEAPGLNRRDLLVHFSLFGVCLLVVLRVIGWGVMLAVVIAVLLVYDRRLLLKADFLLLVTFVCFFVFAGNLARIESVSALLRRLISGRELLVGTALSQVISNVPSALLLSGFTGNARGLLMGVNIGGLGTPVASLASLISLKLYSHSDSADTGKFLRCFLLVNIILLALLLPAGLLLE